MATDAQEAFEDEIERYREEEDEAYQVTDNLFGFLDVVGGAELINDRLDDAFISEWGSTHTLNFVRSGDNRIIVRADGAATDPENILFTMEAISEDTFRVETGYAFPDDNIQSGTRKHSLVNEFDFRRTSNQNGSALMSIQKLENAKAFFTKMIVHLAGPDNVEAPLTA